MTHFPIAAALSATLAVLPVATHAQEGAIPPGMAEIVMASDGSAPEAGVQAVTGWHICDVIRAGAGWGNHYAALTCPTGGFSNRWHQMIAGQKDAMLATSLTAASADEKVQVYIHGTGAAYNEIRALYIQK